jgi:serine/threonine protein kinase
MSNADQLDGSTFGKYKIAHMLGQGGMAYVYKAHHIEFETPVAIKILFPEHAKKPEVLARFRREAKIQFKLQHPNLLRVFDLIDEQGLFGMVMDWVEGIDFQTYLAQKNAPLSHDEIQRLFLPALLAIDYAHQHGIIHRDIKPSNIMLRGNKGSEHVTVMDFGIAKLSQDSLSEDGIKTKTGAVLGTPHFLAPEFIQGQKINHLIDIYALGITLYNICTLRFPFEEENLVALLMAHCTKEMPLPSTFQPNLHPTLENIILRATAKSPQQRFQSCLEMHQALQAFLALAPTLDSRPETTLPHPPPSLAQQSPTAPPSDLSPLPSGEITSPLSQAPLLHTSQPTILYTAQTSRKSKILFYILPPLLFLPLLLLFLAYPSSKHTPTTPPHTPNKSLPPHTTHAAVPSPQTAAPALQQAAQPTPLPSHPSPQTPARTNPPLPPNATANPKPTVRTLRSCKKKGNWSACLACTQRSFRKFLLAAGALDALQDTDGQCSLPTLRKVAVLCHQSCQCDFSLFTKAYLSQEFRSKEGQTLPAKQQPLCKKLLAYPSLRKHLKTYYTLPSR